MPGSVHVFLFLASHPQARIPLLLAPPSVMMTPTGRKRKAFLSLKVDISRAC